MYLKKSLAFCLSLMTALFSGVGVAASTLYSPFSRTTTVKEPTTTEGTTAFGGSAQSAGLAASTQLMERVTDDADATPLSDLVAQAEVTTPAEHLSMTAATAKVDAAVEVNAGKAVDGGGEATTKPATYKERDTDKDKSSGSTDSGDERRPGETPAAPSAPEKTASAATSSDHGGSGKSGDKREDISEYDKHDSSDKGTVSTGRLRNAPTQKKSGSNRTDN